MRLISLLQQFFYILTIAVLLFINTNCKSRNAYWKEILTSQLNRDSNTNQLDSSLYDFMLNYNIPALSITGAKDGKIIYSKTFGVANLSTHEEANNKSLFRIVGTSTVITSLAIRELVARKQISYNSKVFGEGGLLGTKYGYKPYSSLLSAITIADLLNHTTGAWSGADDMIPDHNARSLFSSKDSALSWIIDKFEVKNRPGPVFDFSFTGFFILGIIIEKVTGVPYEKWVKENILQPCGVTDMGLEKDSLLTTHEVNHYKDQSWPFYNGDIDENLYFSRADAAFGWIASSNDLVKLMLNFKYDSSNPQSILPPPAARLDYSPDWNLTGGSKNWWEQFDYFGSTSILVRSSKGFYWSILINTYRPVLKDYFHDIDSIIIKAMDNPAIRWAPQQGQ